MVPRRDESYDCQRDSYARHQPKGRIIHGCGRCAGCRARAARATRIAEHQREYFGDAPETPFSDAGKKTLTICLVVLAACIWYIYYDAMRLLNHAGYSNE
ncbi:hypothetical protein GGS26DRAFT_585879 [Hypomontagnella submonticulosa]|nr:hypothetical protein GGS26DRAFT_585879 [Hypomontagnella submonticulosa]